MGEKRYTYRILVRKPERKRRLGRPRRMWKGNIKMDLRKLEWGGTKYVDLVQGRDQWRALVNTVMSLRVPYNFWKFVGSCTIGGF
jgi:hypothetical protein